MHTAVQIPSHLMILMMILLLHLNIHNITTAMNSKLQAICLRKGMLMAACQMETSQAWWKTKQKTTSLRDLWKKIHRRKRCQLKKNKAAMKETMVYIITSMRRGSTSRLRARLVRVGQGVMKRLMTRAMKKTTLVLRMAVVMI